MGAGGIRQGAERLVELMRLEDAHFVSSEFAQGLDSKELRLHTTRAITFDYPMYKATPVVNRPAWTRYEKHYLKLSLATSEIDDTDTDEPGSSGNTDSESRNRDGTTGKKKSKSNAEPATAKKKLTGRNTRPLNDPFPRWRQIF